MTNLTKLKYYIDSLCVYNVYSDGLVKELKHLLSCENKDEIIERYRAFVKMLMPRMSLRYSMSECILSDDNLFTRAAAAGKTDELPEQIADGAKSDLEKLEEISYLTAEDIIDGAPEEYRGILNTLPKWEAGNAVFPLTDNWAEKTKDLIAFHKENGYGEYVKYAAFAWRGGELQPISTLNNIALSDLKNYERQRSQVLDNTLAFLDGFPANNILLYGDRGTGKSSTVHAVLNEYKTRGLRMIEISKGDINELTLIREKIADSPMKFIIFIDDLSFDSHEDSFGELKAALEGSLSGRQNNTLIYATSNRRHLIKENFADRENDVHRSDTMQEEMSLSDRFGLSVYFENPDKNNFIDILEKIAKDRNLNVDFEKLDNAAELWARRKGGRSPRCAKQFIDYVEACEKRGVSW